MKFFRQGWWMAAALLLAPTAMAAQSQDRVQPDERVRIVAPSAGYDEPVAGTVVELRADTLTLQLGPQREAAGVQVAVPVATIMRLERSAGPGNRVTHGVLGTVIGTGAGAAMGLFHYKLQSVQILEQTGEEIGGREDWRVPITVAGAVIGTVVGVLMPGERWVRVPVLDALTSIQSNVSADGLSVHVTF
ncbi:MAG TPA: hypothetical protein VHG93_10910 [Longimicrobium sp.]|nr:hypothetical protein [Longimicrobium sp.]